MVRKIEMRFLMFQGYRHGGAFGKQACKFVCPIDSVRSANTLRPYNLFPSARLFPASPVTRSNEFQAFRSIIHSAFHCNTVVARPQRAPCYCCFKSGMHPPSHYAYLNLAARHAALELSNSAERFFACLASTQSKRKLNEYFKEKLL